MNKAAVVYWSGTGNTEEMAKAVAAGTKTAEWMRNWKERCEDDGADTASPSLCF